MKLLSSKKYNALMENRRTLMETIQLLEERNGLLKNELQEYMDTKNKDCKKGDYCMSCIYSCKTNEYIGSIPSIVERYVCCYDKCKHFEKRSYE